MWCRGDVRGGGRSAVGRAGGRLGDVLTKIAERVERRDEGGKRGFDKALGRLEAGVAVGEHRDPQAVGARPRGEGLVAVVVAPVPEERVATGVELEAPAEAPREWAVEGDVG